MVPVEVHEVVEVLGEVVVPEALQEVPVDQALDVVLPGRDAEQRDVAVQGDRRPESDSLRPSSLIDALNAMQSSTLIFVVRSRM